MDPVLVGGPSAPPPEPRPAPPLPEAVRVWLAARPRVRRLNFTFQRLEGRPVYILEDPGSSAFYRVGEREYRFLECLDGRRTVGEILTRQAKATPELALDPGNVLRLLEMLRAEGLLDEPERLPAAAGDGGVAVRRPGWIDRLGNILYLRFSFGHPDRFFGWLYPWLGWAVHPLAWLAGLGLLALGGVMLIRHGDRMRDSTLSVLSPDKWLWIGIIFVVMRAIHEIWHGLTCRRWGGPVRDIGVVLIAFFPVGYVDVTSSWGFPSRWRRFLVSAAGPFIDLCIAAAAVVIWSHTGPGLVNTLAWQTVLTAGVSNLIVNCNPLMRFDGYYIMTDLLDLPNLYSRAQVLWRALIRRVLLGIRGQEIPALREWGWRVALVYAPAAACWRVFTMLNILAVAGAMFRGSGIALVCVTLLAWSRGSAAGQFRWFQGLPLRTRILAAGRLLVMLGVGIAILFLPWQMTVSVPALVDWADRCDVYAGCSGVLEAVEVDSGTRVKAGTEVARIANPDLDPEVDRARVLTAKEELKARISLREDDLPGWASSHAAAGALREDSEHLAVKAGRRQVLSPTAGVVYDERLDRRIGQYVREGEPLFSIGHAADREVIALIPQERLALAGLHPGDEVEVWVPGRTGTWRVSVDSVSPAARQQIEHPGLTALGGGHLPVKPRAREETEGGKGGFELQDPQFELRVRLAGPEASELRAGERSYLRTRTGVPVELWRLAYGRLERFWSRLLSREPRFSFLE